MAVKTFSQTVNTEGWGDTKNLTPEAEKYINKSGLSDGILTVFVPGSTGAITTIEFESGVVKDLAGVLERQVPADAHYHHNERWHDGNGFSHVRSALVGPSLTVPFSNGKLILGTWQQIVLLDFDNNPRSREVVFQIIGE